MQVEEEEGREGYQGRYESECDVYKARGREGKDTELEEFVQSILEKRNDKTETVQVSVYGGQTQSLILDCLLMGKIVVLHSVVIIL